MGLVGGLEMLFWFVFLVAEIRQLSFRCRHHDVSLPKAALCSIPLSIMIFLGI